MSASYVLGYYTSNSNWNGSVRRITVRLKAGGDKVRARREYRAPTQEEMAAIAAGAAPPSEAAAAASVIDAALAPLAKLRAAAALHVYGAAGAGEVAIVAELGPAAVARWKGGGDLQVLVTDGAGETIGVARGRLEAGARAVLMRVPVTARGADTRAWEAMVRLRAEGLPNEEQRAAVATPSGTLVGDPLLFRSAAPGAARKPVGSLEFLRSERMRIEWPLLGKPERREARLLGRDGRPIPIAVDLTEESSGAALLVADLTLAPLAAGDYLVELTAASRRDGGAQADAFGGPRSVRRRAPAPSSAFDSIAGCTRFNPRA